MRHFEVDYCTLSRHEATSFAQSKLKMINLNLDFNYFITLTFSENALKGNSDSAKRFNLFRKILGSVIRSANQSPLFCDNQLKHSKFGFFLQEELTKAGIPHLHLLMDFCLYSKEQSKFIIESLKELWMGNYSGPKVGRFDAVELNARKSSDYKKVLQYATKCLKEKGIEKQGDDKTVTIPSFFHVNNYLRSKCLEREDAFEELL